MGKGGGGGGRWGGVGCVDGNGGGTGGILPESLEEGLKMSGD